jgi:hypothetical protein
MRSGWMTTMLPFRNGMTEGEVLLADREEHAEVGVGRDDDAVILGGVVKDVLV